MRSEISWSESVMAASIVWCRRLAENPLARAVGGERHLEAERVRRTAADADAPDPLVHAALMVRRAQRRAVPGVVGALVRAKHDVVAVQVPIGRAARHRAAPAVALEHAVVG